MKIGIDYISAFGTGGNGTYTRELVKALARQDSRDELELYTYVHHLWPRRRYPDVSERARFRGVYLPSFPIAELTRFADGIAKSNLRRAAGSVDVMHFTNPLFWLDGLPRKVRTIVTIHDLSFFKNRLWVKEGTLKKIIPMLERIAHEADEIIAVSESTKLDLIERYPAAAHKTRVVYEGVSASFHSDPHFSLVNVKYGIEKPYVLAVGEIQPRKNLATLIDAFSRLSKPLLNEYDLVLIGASRSERTRKEIGEMVQATGLEGNVRMLGHIPQEDLIRFYNGAVIFAFIPYYEGFGLPVLEAMACGAPVLSSHGSSMPEVGGDACLYADPNAVEEVSQKLSEFLTNAKLRELFREKGFARAKFFTWERAAQETSRVYGEFAG